MKILHLLDVPWWSGLSSYAFDCVQCHRSLGHDVILACAGNSLPYQKAKEKKWTVAAIGGRSALGSFYNFFRIGALIVKENPDWILSHTGSTHWIVWLWSKLFKFKLARTRSTSQELKKTLINRKIYSESDKIVAASGHLGKNCSSFLNGNSGKISVLYPPVQIPDIPDAISETVQSKAVGILARLDPVKGHRDLLHAFKIVQSAFPGAELHLAGPEENLLWADLLKEIRSLNLKNVVYHGFLPHEKIWDFMRKFAIGVVSSTGSEEVSRALLEWMAAGKPVIATDVGCIPEILIDGEGGYVVPASNPEPTAARIKELLIRPDLCKKMGDFNRRRCQNEFSMERFSGSWGQLLQS